ncbi:hypothetical protein M501DRAFT_222725 [Patellaria atrata CBS 101060]|uniref:Ankyrin repeat protein n=1 Tax=Patellaria atrata CBS 101060 TaxID=1346257 RepID=A0A9P4S6M4_9PEZI|nr:hypothetical protein M501DRAFT_222725 [Patellaria atrata CBS 101060]
MDPNQPVEEESVVPETPVRTWLSYHGMLPSAMPKARILRFGYDYQDLKQPTLASIRSVVARTLLQELKTYRARPTPEYRWRPIIFIGHGFGGIIIEGVLALANGSMSHVITHSPIEETLSHQSEDVVKSESNLDILRSTIGVIFLATPFMATNAVLKIWRSREIGCDSSDSQIRKLKNSHFAALSDGSGTSVQAKSTETPNPQTARAGPPSGNVFKHIRSSLDFLASQYNIELVCFFEEQKDMDLEKLSSLQVILDKRSSTLDNYQHIGLPVTHTAMSKFYGTKDPNYRKFLNVLQDIESNIPTRRLWHSISIRANIQGLLEVPGVNVNKQDNQGGTALHLAAGFGASQAIFPLLRKGADVRIRDLNGNTALDIANLVGNETVIKYLTENASGEYYKSIQTIPGQEADNEVDFNKWNYGLKDVEPSVEECRKKACIGFHAKVTCFSPSRTHPLFRYQWNPTVYDALYDPSHSNMLPFRDGVLRRADTLNRESKTAMQASPDSESTIGSIREVHKENFTWYHLPANNIVWVKILLKRILREEVLPYEMKTIIHKLSGQQHRGHTPFSHYMRAGCDVVEIPSSIKLKATTEASDPSPPEVKIALNSKHTYGRKGDSKVPKQRETDIALKLFMPYFHFESMHAREYLMDSIHSGDAESLVDKPNENFCENTDLLHAHETLLKGYLDLEQTYSNSKRTHSELHMRRSLDQFYYHALDKDDIRRRDEDQVMYKWYKENKLAESYSAYKEQGKDKIEANDIMTEDEFIRKDCKIVMVDQLWCWIIGDHTVITSFPEAAEVTDENIIDKIEKEIERYDTSSLLTIGNFATVIMNCAAGFLDRFRAPTILPILDAFDLMISKALKHEMDMFDAFKEQIKKSEEEQESGKRNVEIPFKLSVRSEVERLRDIKDIKDELKIIQQVLNQQLDVGNSFQSLGGANLSAVKALYGRVACLDKEEFISRKLTHIEDDVEDIKRITNPQNSFPLTDNVTEEPQESEEQPDIQSFHSQDADTLLNTIKDNLKAVDLMLSQAEEAHHALKLLLNLKQKQANVQEARATREGAEDTAKQGRAIMLFTIITIVFLPLSFLSSFFALNVRQFPHEGADEGEPLFDLSWVAGWIFGISAAFILPAIVGALIFVDPQRVELLLLRAWMPRLLTFYAFLLSGVWYVITFGPCRTAGRGLRDRRVRRKREKRRYDLEAVSVYDENFKTAIEEVESMRKSLESRREKTGASQNTDEK